MPTAPKIEDILNQVPSTPFPQTPPKSMGNGKVSFPKILDYTFPQEMPESQVVEVGEVTYVGDGICHAAGLSQAKIDEIIEIKTSRGTEKALILGIQANRVEAVVLGDYTHIKRGDGVRSTSSKLKVPVGPQTIGRVINPLGIPLDGLGPIHADEHRDVEFAAPGVVDRAPITKPLHTGIMAIDTTIPIGKGQRELVIGDRKTGKSRTMLDIISNQRGQDVFCIYVGVGVQAAKAKATMELLTKRAGLKHTTLIIALSDDPPSIQYIAPYVGAALGEYYMYQGKHALVIYDDLSKQAKAYRQVSLLLKRSPGRDAYPGDIFFLHSRLLERAAQLIPQLGGGSMTALPVAETQVGDISDYIITNLMSITDGHIYLDANMMHEGILPAINSGASVSRIGGKVQTPLLRKVGELAGRILARYNEVKSFETINTEVTESTMLDIKRGKRIKEILSQPSGIATTPDEEVVLLGLSVSNRMDHFDAAQVIKFKTSFLPYFRKIDVGKLKEKIKTAKDFAEVDKELDLIFNDFCRTYQLPLLE